MVRTSGWPTFLLLVAALLAPAAEAGGLPGYLGREVASVSIRADTQIDTEKFAAAILVTEGRPLDSHLVRDSIHALYATGQFRDIRVDAVIAEDGRVAVTFLVFVSYRVASIAFDGLAGSLDAAKAQVATRLGDVFSLAAVDRSANAMTAWLRRRGYLEAVVDPATDFERSTRSATITFYVTAGPRASIGSVRFEGELGPFRESDLLGMLGRKGSEPYTSVRAGDWSELLRRRLVAQGHRAAEVRLESESYSAEARAMNLVYRVDVGPIVVVELKGDSARAVRKMLPRGKREPYSADELDRAVDEIVDYYQSKGYYFATVDVEEERTREKLTVLFVASRGEKHDLKEVDFTGNIGIPAETLLKALETRRPSILQETVTFFFRRGLGVTEATLDDDRDAIEALYRAQGYLDVTTGKPKVEIMDGGGLKVVFPIFEGPRTIVRSVSIEGNEAISDAKLPELGTRAEKPMSPLTMARDMVLIQSAYDAEGYPDSRIEQETLFSEDRTSGDVVFKVTEGGRFRIGDVSVVGNTFTADKVALIKTRDILKKGMPLSVATLNRAQRELYKLAVFGRVSLIPKPATGDDTERDVEIRVEEGRAVRLTGSVGYSTDEDFRVSAAVSHRNLFGSARYLGLEAIYSDPRQKLVLTFQEPFTFNRDLPTQFSIFTDDEFKDDVLLEKHGMFVEVSKLLRRDLRLSLRLDYKVVNTTCDPSLDEKTCNELVTSIGQEEKEDTIASVTQTFFWDRRNDLIDPKEGFLLLGSVEYAFPALEAEPSFLKGYLQGNWYLPVGKATLAFSARAGAIDPRNNLDDPINPVPYSERFFGGGENSHRGFRLDELGILGEFGKDGEIEPPGATIFDDTDPDIAFTPQGGNALLIGNVELRYPFNDALGVAAFLDVGQVWRLVSTVDFDYLRYAVGTGVFYRTPVGPIRFDIAYNIDAEPHESEWLEFLTIGFAF